MFDLQKAGIFKRFSAFLCDAMAFLLLSLCLSLILSSVLGYDKYNNTITEARERYAKEYNIDLNITAEEREALPEDVKQRYEAADKAYGSDVEVARAHAMADVIIMLLVSLSVFIPAIILEFVVPLIFKNGQTIGKKIFGIAVMRTNGVRISTPALFIRSILGKATMETMVPVCIIIMILMGKLGIVGIAVLVLIAVLQVVMMVITQTNSAIHDLLSDSVVVDFASQRIFNSEEELLELKKKIHEEAVQRADY